MLEGAAESILSIIDGVGRDVDIRSFADSGDRYNPTRAPTDVSARAAIVNFKAKDQDGSRVQMDDKKAYIAHTSVVTKKNKIVDGSLEYNIQELRLVQPGDEKFLYIVHLRI